MTFLATKYYESAQNNVFLTLKHRAMTDINDKEGDSKVVLQRKQPLSE